MVVNELEFCLAEASQSAIPGPATRTREHTVTRVQVHTPERDHSVENLEKPGANQPDKTKKHRRRMIA